MEPFQKAAAQAIVNIFETGCVSGDYGRVTLLPGDTGRLTYGRSQTTLASSNLHRLIRDYVNAPAAKLSNDLRPWLPALERKDAELNHDERFKTLLKRAGDDPVMRRVQDAFFDRAYWRPALRSAASARITEPLGIAVVYDSRIHGSWGRVRRLTERRIGKVEAAGGERAWVAGYVSVRREWLASRQSELLRRTIYRMDAFRDLIDAANWDLEPPFDVRGIRITRAALDPGTPHPAESSAGDAPRV